ncbi:13840_t:CDS:2 [Entrophospora sp. SA101]|nr:13840_t:CDS:2 [Entrophospora sp. SA101]
MASSNISTVYKGNKLFRDISVDFQRVVRGDSGIDIFGNYNHYLLLIQCKDFTNKIDVDYIRAFESIVARFDKDNTIRVYVILAKDGYAKGSVERVNSPERYLLFTNIWNLDRDISEYLSKISKDNSVEGKLHKIEKGINEIIEMLESQEKLIHKIRNDQIILAAQTQKVKFQILKSLNFMTHLVLVEESDARTKGAKTNIDEHPHTNLSSETELSFLSFQRSADFVEGGLYQIFGVVHYCSNRFYLIRICTQYRSELE